MVIIFWLPNLLSENYLWVPSSILTAGEYRVNVNGIIASDPDGLNKDDRKMFCLVFWVQQETPEERRNVVNIAIKVKTMVNDKNHPASSQKFRKLMRFSYSITCPS